MIGNTITPEELMERIKKAKAPIEIGADYGKNSVTVIAELQYDQNNDVILYNEKIAKEADIEILQARMKEIEERIKNAEKSKRSY